MANYGLIGYPLSHSFSSVFFRNYFIENEIKDCLYTNFEIESIKSLREIIEANNLIGLNITIPYKEEVIKYLDDLDSIAKEIGAVNTIKVINQNGKKLLKGYNTDAFGFEYTLTNYFNKKVIKEALILGTGGASKAVAYVLKKNNVNFVFATRNIDTLNKNHINYNAIDKDTIANMDIVINCTPLGMYPNIDEYPLLPYQYLRESTIFYDLIYNPVKTKFLQKGEEQNCIIINGKEMLQQQAIKGWAIWNDDKKFNY
ncbi:MAG: hypothetical protein A2X12_00640 [Bacteroidetes bacterium GWE2_29_8]|nr:MAG: hypothetical protein A2X12_00640 [Bacteroidetes bacterium GWE2_29_8]OFY20641.1 MAG: hypothetical protein A2X02_06160 [Bacteroidetes bacterium GWF2_29_10]